MTEGGGQKTEDRNWVPGVRFQVSAQPLAFEAANLIENGASALRSLCEDKSEFSI